MPDKSGKSSHFGPDVSDVAGPAAIHRMIHEAAVGKTVARVYLGELELEEPYEPGGSEHTEYLLLEFTDGSTLALQVGSGNSFFVGGEDEIKRTRSRPT